MTPKDMAGVVRRGAAWIGLDGHRQARQAGLGEVGPGPEWTGRVGKAGKERYGEPMTGRALWALHGDGRQKG